ncbi:hypothetical protein [Campylobacter estrildidarum]|uniref:Uncharacterized protein n=1 Tax=Campylobacter estrildidarum TaxID=2510189 RepID=A0A4U7BMS1_9BACT|nr:hypothetical protein [Campylobacter estrildidarum]TKX31500.1 hypothetical protein CQA69_02445 [Campylobacter estrildidarum]
MKENQSYKNALSFLALAGFNVPSMVFANTYKNSEKIFVQNYRAKIFFNNSEQFDILNEIIERIFFLKR